MATIIRKITKRFNDWFGYYNGPINVFTGREFKQGPGFDVTIEVFQIRRFGIRIVKDVKVHTDPYWLDSLKTRIEEK